MEIISPRRFNVGWRDWDSGQRVAALLLACLFAAAIYGAIAYISKQPVVIQGDYEPFASKQEYDAFYASHPLLRQSAPAGENFRYTSSVTPAKQPLYRIYLRTPSVKGGSSVSSAEYASLLRTYQHEAEDWFAANHENLSKAYVQWVPDPASYEPTPSPTPHTVLSSPGSPPSTSPTATPASRQFPR